LISFYLSRLENLLVLNGINKMQNIPQQDEEYSAQIYLQEIRKAGPVRT
jgi:hypothetical protein